MIAPLIGDETQIEIAPNITFGDIDGEIVALNIESGHYLHLNSTGSYIFSLVDEFAPQSLEDIYQLVCQTYDVEDDTCRCEVSEFISRCLTLGLIRLAA